MEEIISAPNKMPYASENSATSSDALSTRDRELKDRLNRLIEKGKGVEATSSKVDIHQLPDYFDEARFKVAQVTCQKYYSNISLASTTGLISLVQIESILVPLLKTGRSRTVANLLDRYIDTALYIRKCYETDFYKNSSKGWESILLVRSMHQRVHKLMMAVERPAKIGFNSESDVLWVNQYDMVLTQFAFIGLFLLKPAKCGAYHATTEELSNVAYYWRLISYYFGIEEQFNLFSYCDDLDKQLEYTKLVLDHYNDLLSENQRKVVGTRMAEGIMLAFEDFNTESSFNILDHWWAKTISLSGRKRLKRYSLTEATLKLPLFYLYFKLLFRNRWLLRFMNEKFKKKFDKFCLSRDKTKIKLQEKYGDLLFESES